MPKHPQAAANGVQRYRTIVVDPPWPYKASWTAYRGKNGQPRKVSASANYPVISVVEIAHIPVGDWAEDDAHMYIWTTGGFMVEAHALARQWGFEPKTVLVWVKTRLGMGSYYRNNTEFVVFAVRGSQPPLRRDCRTAFEGEQAAHSEKPAAFYDMVESMSPGPYLDVFARKHRFNWDVYGNEVYSDIPLVEAAALGRERDKI